jgi:hypothetical protein
MQSKIGYALVSKDHYFAPIEGSDICKKSICLKLGCGRIFNRAAQYRGRLTKLIFMCTTISSVDQRMWHEVETNFRKKFEELFQIEPEENSREEYIISIDKLEKINGEYNFCDANDHKKILAKMIQETKYYFMVNDNIETYTEEYDNEIEKINNEQHKQGRQIDDVLFKEKCTKLRKFMRAKKDKNISGRRKITLRPQTKANQLVMYGYYNEKEVKLANWFNINLVLNKKGKLSSIRGYEIDLLLDYEKELTENT